MLALTVGRSAFAVWMPYAPLAATLEGLSLPAGAVCRASRRRSSSLGVRRTRSSLIAADSRLWVAGGASPSVCAICGSECQKLIRGRQTLHPRP